MNLTKKLNQNKIYIILYLTLLIEFYFNVDLAGGARPDWGGYIDIIEKFNNNFFNSLISYNTFGDRHSPVFHIFLLIFKKLSFSYDDIRLINLHLSLLIIPLFYKCIKLKYKEIDKKYLKLLTCLFFFSITFRSLSIWPSSRIYGLIFLLISIHYFLIFLEKKEFSSTIKNIFFLAISSYFSPNFALFSIYFFIKFYMFYKFSLKIFFISVTNIILSLPALYYIFFLGINFLIQPGTPGATGEFFSISSPEFNFSNKIVIILPLIFLYLFPILIYKFNFNKFYRNFKLFIFLGIPIFFLCIFNFNYQISYTGGGLFFLSSNILFKNNFFLYLIFFISIYFIFFNNFNLNNSFIYLLLILSNIQLTIYHKYYDPLLLILAFTLLNFKLKKDFFVIKNILVFYLIYISLIILKIIKLYVFNI